MKTEIEINGVVYKVGNILERYKYAPLTILFIGTDSFFCEHYHDYSKEKRNCTLDFRFVNEWKIAKPTKRIKHEFWVNHYDDGIDKIAYNSESEARANSKVFANFFECKKYTYEKEIEI